MLNKDQLEVDILFLQDRKMPLSWSLRNCSEVFVGIKAAVNMTTYLCKMQTSMQDK